MHKQQQKALKQHYKKLENNKYIAKFGSFVHAKNLWTFNRHSIIWGITIGIMCAWIPMPFHTTIAIAFGILIDCNIPLITLSIWISNPFTMPFMYYIAYRLGEAIMHWPPSDHAFHPSIKDLVDALHTIWQPLLLGCAICSLCCGVIVYTLLNLCWNTKLVQRFWRKLIN